MKLRDYALIGLSTLTLGATAHAQESMTKEPTVVPLVMPCRDEDLDMI